MSLINAFIINCCLEVTPSHHTVHKKSRWYLKGCGKRALQRSNRTSIKWSEKLLFSFAFSLSAQSMRECGLWIIVWSIVQALKCFLVSNVCVVLGNEPGNWIPFVPIKNCAQYMYLSNIILRPVEICLLLLWMQSECWYLIMAILISTMSSDLFIARIMTLWRKYSPFPCSETNTKRSIFCHSVSFTVFPAQSYLAFFVGLQRELFSPGVKGAKRLHLLRQFSKPKIRGLPLSNT